MDQIITLNSLNQLEFAKELKKNPTNPQMIFQITDALAQNINILMYYMNKHQVTTIIFKGKIKNIDIICLKKFVAYFQKYYLFLSKTIQIIFEDYLTSELQLYLGERNYLNYCSQNNITPQWNTNHLNKEKIKIQNNSHLKKYSTFNTLIKIQEELPFSYFNFPKEENTDRFVFYFHMYSDKQKQKILQLIQDLNLQNYHKLINLITTNKINDEIFYYAIGFSYQNNKLIRLTLYTKFAEQIISKNKIPKFLKEKHNLDFNEPYSNIWYYAIDFYSDNSEEIKIYDEPYKFNQQLNNIELFKTLQNKMCVKVIKFKNNFKINEKYEFEINKVFTESEKQTLAKYNLFKPNNKILAIYTKNGKIVKKIFYEL